MNGNYPNRANAEVLENQSSWKGSEDFHARNEEIIINCGLGSKEPEEGKTPHRY
jgi:hypothetical protein